VSYLFLAWIFFASFVTTLVVVAVVPRLVKLALVLFALKRARLEIAGAIGLAATPDVIHLERPGEDDEHAATDAKRLAEELEREGFSDAGTFAVREMPGVLVRLLAHEEDCLWAAAYQHPVAGSWIDVVERRVDGGSTTWTTSPPTGLDQRPGHRQLHEPGASAAALVARARAERGPAAAFPARPAEARSTFERGYAESMAWKKQRGVTEAEVARLERRPIGTPA
jgi:hypothetical protein